MNATAAVDGYIRKNKAWSAELQKLREIILSCGLTEDVKWRVPCYTLDNRNVVFVGPLKASCVISFVKGVLLTDPQKVLVQQTENSQSVRVIRYANVQEIEAHEALLTAYVKEAVEIERRGERPKLKTTAEFTMPDEFKARLDRDAKLKKAFEALTPGRQRGYLLHFGGAKQAKTRETRIDKYVPHILAGKGLDDE